MGLASTRGRPLTVPDTYDAWKETAMSEASVAATGTAQPPPSILFPERMEGAPCPAPASSRSLSDLNLDQLLTTLSSGREEYNLGEYFFAPLRTTEAVTYRHEVFRDLEDDGTRAVVNRFCASMARVRTHLRQAKELRHDVQRQHTLLMAATTYVDAVNGLLQGLEAAPLSSGGLTSLRAGVSAHATSVPFKELSDRTRSLVDRLSRVTYRLHLSLNSVTVSLPQDEEEDYAADVAETFRRFQQGEVESHLSTLRDYLSMNHVEEAIADRVVKLHPEVFAALSAFSSDWSTFVDAALETFDREAQFCLAWLELMDRLKARGLSMCYPSVAAGPEPVTLKACYDIVLADLLDREGTSVVCNDLAVTPEERLIVVTGPNQGGKTTFARMVGQVCYLATLGLPVPGREARLPLADQVLTHFEQGEKLGDRIGALEDDLLRVRTILDRVTPASVVVLNELFTSTSAQDAVDLSSRVLRQVVARGCLCICVTFLDELASLTKDTVSLVGQVDADDPATRTFEVVRQPANGSAFAEAIARRHGLSRGSLRRRLQQ